MIIISDMMEMDERKNGSSQAVDFIELISQDLPWDDIDCALGDKPDQLAATVTDIDTCSPAEQEFNPDDLSLFNAFASSLPSVAAHASCNMDIKATVSSVVPVKGNADTGTDLAQDIETDLHEEDFECADEISLCSQMEDIMADILESSVAVLDCDEKQATENNSKQVHNETEEHSVLQSDDDDLNSDAHIKQTELPRSVKSSRRANKVQCRMNETTFDVAVNGKNRTRRLGKSVTDSSSITDQNKADVEGGAEVHRDEKVDSEQCTVCDNGCQDCDHNNDNENDDELTASQEWVHEQLHTHIVQQHDEALRLNSLRVRLPPPPGTTPVPCDPVSRAIHAFTTEVEAMKLNTEMNEALLADNPNISECCKLLGDYNPYELSPGVLVQYPFFAGTVDVCCRWEGDLADELHAVAHRLRGFMMAMYARHSVHEGFLTALDRQVCHCY